VEIVVEVEVDERRKEPRQVVASADEWVSEISL
jgi:hypothetical protein